MQHLLLALAAASLNLLAIAAQSTNPGLGRAVDYISRHDVNGLRRLLREEPALVRRTDAGLLPHWNWTLLHRATTNSIPLGVIEALIDAGAPVNVVDSEGNTPLHFATKRISRELLPAQDYEGIIRRLLDARADVHIRNVAGATPLHTAAASRADPAAIELLIRAGAAVNLKASAAAGGWTPLHGAAARGSADIIKVLLEHGADSKLTDAKGLTPLQVAEQGGFTAAAAILRPGDPTAATVAPARGSVALASPAPPAPMPAAGGIVQGRVLWNGQPVAGATVFVTDNPPGVALKQPEAARYGSVTTDTEGRFRISAGPEGNRYVGAIGDPSVFGSANGATFTMTTSPFTRDFSLCKGFNIVAPADNASVSGRPLMQWEPFPDATHYVVAFQGNVAIVYGTPTGGLTDTRLQVPADLPPGRHQWRVFAYTASGQPFGCTALRSLNVQP